MDFRQMQLFVAVAEELHFGRAALRVHMAQPPLSQHIRKLERELGLALFERTSRKVMLTPAGVHLLARARELLTRRDEAIASVVHAAKGELGVLRIGFGASSAFGVLPTILQRFRGKFPKVVLHLNDSETLDLGLALHRGELDVAIVRAPFRYENLASQRLLRENLALAMPSKHPLSRESGLKLAALAQEPFIFFPRPSAPGLYDTMVGLCLKAGFSPHVAHEASSWPSVATLVHAGLGITIAPMSARAMFSHGIVFKELVDVRAKAELLLAFPRQNLSPIAANFIALAKQSRVAAV